MQSLLHDPVTSIFKKWNVRLSTNCPLFAPIIQNPKNHALLVDLGFLSPSDLKPSLANQNAFFFYSRFLRQYVTPTLPIQLEVRNRSRRPCQSDASLPPHSLRKPAGGLQGPSLLPGSARHFQVPDLSEEPSKERDDDHPHLRLHAGEDDDPKLPSRRRRGLVRRPRSAHDDAPHAAGETVGAAAGGCGLVHAGFL